MSTLGCVSVHSGATFMCMVLLCHLHYSSAQSSLSAVTPASDVLNTSLSTCEAGSGDCPTSAPTSPTNTTDLQTTLSSLSSTDPTVAATETKNKNGSTPTTPKPDSPTAAPSSTVAPAQSKTQQPEGEQDRPSEIGICSCDLTANYCDINCCCDSDCSTTDRRAFSQCKSHRYPLYDDKYCYSHKIVFRNNTEHILQQTQNGLFCIVRSNLAASVVHPSQNSIESQEVFNQRWQRSHIVTWPDSLLPGTTISDTTQPYVAGTPVLVLKDSKLKSVDLPSAGLTSACTSVKTILFLEPWSGKCVNKAPVNPSECESLGLHHYYNSLRIVQSPLLINRSELISNPMNQCMKNVCTPANTFLCPDQKHPSESISGCFQVPQPDLLFGFNAKTNVCHGVVRHLKFVFHHNGTRGIHHINTYLWLANVSMTLKNKIPVPIHQWFSVDFEWLTHNFTVNATDSITNGSTRKAPFVRSGRRGYMIGRPVPAGFRITQIIDTNSAKDTKDKRDRSGGEVVNLSRDESDWLTLPQPHVDGSCGWSSSMRYPVTFGENIHTSCAVTLESTNFSSSLECSNLRRSMVRLLLGSSADQLLNSSQALDWARVIAVFGDADTSEDDDWISLLIDEIPPSLLLPQPTAPTVPSVSTVRSTPMQPSKSAQLAAAPTMLTCESIPLGIELRVMHSLVGAVSNPQSKIIGASVRFTPMQDVSRECSQPYCTSSDDGSSFRLPIVSTVTFVDVSSPAVTRFAEPPAIHIRLPPDFFYPFISRESAAETVNRSNVMLCVLSLYVLHLLLGFL